MWYVLGKHILRFVIHADTILDESYIRFSSFRLYKITLSLVGFFFHFRYSSFNISSIFNTLTQVAFYLICSFFFRLLDREIIYVFCSTLSLFLYVLRICVQATMKFYLNLSLVVERASTSFVYRMSRLPSWNGEYPTFLRLIPMLHHIPSIG